LLAKEDDLRLDKTFAVLTAWYGLCFDVTSNFVFWVWRSAFDTTLFRKRAMSLDDLLPRYTSFSVEAVDILSEVLQQQSFVMKQAYERMGDGWPILSRIQFVRKSVERFGVLPEVVLAISSAEIHVNPSIQDAYNVKDSFGIGEVQSS
jgi:hypothetical protein